jgi:hypothetical protein
MILILFTSILFAAPLVIIDDNIESNQPVQSIIDSNTEVVQWSAIQNLPLSLKNIESERKCLGSPTTLTDIEESLTKAKSGINYFEIEKALGHLSKIENDIVCVSEKVPTELLTKTYFYMGIAHNYNNDTEKAVQSWRQAFI